MKKSLAVAAVVALAGVLTATAAGCSTKSRNLASLSSNWYYDSSYKRIQPTFTEANAEKMTYKVTQSEQSKNAYYKLAYTDGAYVTEFYAKKVTATELANITLEKWRDNYTAALGSDGSMFLYYYKTELSIPSVTYTCGKESQTFTDQTVKSESYFLSVENRLSPVYSYRAVHMTIPKGLQAGSLKSACYTEDMVYESFYSLSGSSVKTYITDNLGENNKVSEYAISGLNRYDNSVFDYTYLDITARAMRNITSFNQTISLYTPGVKVRDYTVSSGKTALPEDELTAVQGVLAGKGLFTPKSIENSEEKTKLKTTSVSVSYNGGSYSGVSQTYWFAIGDGNNETRTVMVKYREPLTYSQGCLDYVLQSIENFPA